MITTSRLGLQVPQSTDNQSAFPAVAAQQMGVLDNAVTVTSGTLAALPASGVVGQRYYATDVNQLFDWNGSKWVTPTVQSMSSLPSSPYDGQEVVYQTGTAGVVWRFRYNAESSSSLKWEFVGGSDMQANGITGTAYNFEASVWRVIPSPALTLPFTGTYDFDAEASIYPTSGNVSIQAFGAGRQGGNGPYGGMTDPGAQAMLTDAYSHVKVTQRGTDNAGSVVSWGAWFQQNATVNFASVAVRIRPVAVQGP